MAAQTSPGVALGIDVGGSAVKGALVDVARGHLRGEQVTIPTPRPATPEAVAETVADIASRLDWAGPVGVAFPSVIVDQVALTAANIDPAWIGTGARETFTSRLGTSEVSVLNDADAAGLAEVAFGDPAARSGAVLFLTFGTGIGSALFIDGRLFPNTELGHLMVGSEQAEHQASSAVKDRLGLSFEQWARRVDAVLGEYEALFNPSLIVVGGGISENAEKWVGLLNTRARVIPAQLRNRAGIIGAAMAAVDRLTP
ncbi:polyphosphate--glucose phosphotransferase [Corynebacterium liangguodongii]|uniref:Polyphosphate glucokinase n=1 Tax=Corynebacterium liangguodongii TaxID=2079535 RepID=A0A2S0WED9_9CORY|nr:ROK family protein [Corynebacterium liangguodongii]AWB84147.1 polyphosphate glucokinase [Corynebacterium liangguodongii]PWC00158.1 ROK family protein [Corynebacterium liangguodongii]